MNAGVLSVTGTTNTVFGATTIAATGTAQMNVSGNYTNYFFRIGGTSGAVGVLRQSGNLTSTVALGFGESVIGNVAGSYGAWLMSGGTAAFNQTTEKSLSHGAAANVSSANKENFFLQNSGVGRPSGGSDVA